jgi:hypothetical protein
MQNLLIINVTYFQTFRAALHTVNIRWWLAVGQKVNFVLFVMTICVATKFPHQTNCCHFSLFFPLQRCYQGAPYYYRVIHKCRLFLGGMGSKILRTMPELNSAKGDQPIIPPSDGLIISFIDLSKKIIGPSYGGRVGWLTPPSYYIEDCRMSSYHAY